MGKWKVGTVLINDKKKKLQDFLRRGRILYIGGGEIFKTGVEDTNRVDQDFTERLKEEPV